MAEIIQSKKALAVNPLKVSQPVGASLAFLGLARSLPLMHGSQGCTAFGKVFFVRHFREPIPLQTTAMDQVSTIMGADENVIEALRTLSDKSKPDIIGLVTTGLSETQGTDIKRAVKDFRVAHPEFAGVAVVPVNTPDYVGCLESGYALAIEALIDTLVPASAVTGKRPKQVNVLASAMLTPGDIEAVREWIEAFGLRAVVVPDIGDSLDGHLTDVFGPDPGRYAPFRNRDHGRIGSDPGDRAVAPQGGRSAENPHRGAGLALRGPHGAGGLRRLHPGPGHHLRQTGA